MEQLALEAHGVSKRYGDREVLASVDLVAQYGRLHGLLGPNGAGKTTLMRALLGLVRRDGGTVRLLGVDLDSTAGLLPEGVSGFVETPAFYPYLSGRQNLTLLTHLDGARRFGRQSEVISALEQVGLESSADVAVRGYSAGMRQRLGLAAALLRTPQLLFLDEPTSSLDPGGARDIRTLAQQMAEEGAAVIFSSHDMTEVEELCTTLTVVNRGRVVFSGAVDDLRRRAPGTIHAIRTSDDRAALDLARDRCGLRVTPADDSLEASADVATLDAYVIALAHAGVAIRSLERRARSLESLFLELTGTGETRQPSTPLARDLRGESRASSMAL